MSEHLHPDADSLNAFIEGVLPEHERLACLAHLADCLRCREIVYLAQEPVAPAPLLADRVPFWKGWFTPIPVLAAAVVCVLLVSIGVYRLIPPKRIEPVLTAVATPQFEPPAPSPAKSVATRKPAPPVKRPAIIPNAAPAAAPVAVAPPPPPPPAIFSAGQQAFVETQPAPQAGIAGTVTDTAGGVIAGALVTVRPPAGTPGIDTRTDGKGQFSLAGLAPGPYELDILSPGFKQAKRQIDLQPQLVARADSRLEVGAATETITVTNEAPLLKTESGSALPARATAGAAVAGGFLGGVPASTTASKDKLMVKADSAGALSFSKNGGKSWKAVKPDWRGRVVRVESAHVAGAVFQLTTDSGSVWLSRDGTHWNPAPSPR